ncbi:aldose 1-epimerase [Lewinella marina]|uniref:Aldose 1-epimerase n=1 Tax=Neolewinella marina TaxID=438751 RepID=A0A2G0CDN1_9BACT|nr:aldose epimerase family protein [Neolewinella marina]NJB85944.1 aldose 1-epimerase [Neolewinella marina]PHK98084.1 galactose-1-epimerase [Neolewinella marina]
MPVTHESWGQCPAGPVTRYLLTNAAGNTVAVLNYGGIVQSIVVDGAEMVLGCDDLQGYLDPNPSYGAIVGRYANRIADARFTLDGRTYELVANENGNQLHGGPEGFNRQLWEAEPLATDTTASVKLRRRSPDGEMGYPGNLDVTVTYTWTDDNVLRIDYAATTDRDTVLNLTNHTYFNIGQTDTVLDQQLQLHADRFTPVDGRQIPTGELPAVEGTPFDFRAGKPVGRDIRADHPQLRAANGFDHNFVISGYDGSLRECAVVTDPATGRRLRCLTTEPGVQLFTTNFPTGKYQMRGGAPTPTYGGLCLETQHFPDAPNQENFVTPLLKVGNTFNSTTEYRFE